MCFAGLDAEVDPRTGVSKCLPNVAYVSVVNMFVDNWKDCFKEAICNQRYNLGGESKLRQIEAGSKEQEDAAFV
jgi:hypothetical protein